MTYNMTGIVHGSIDWEGKTIEYTAKVSGTQTVDPPTYWDPGWSEEEGPFFDSIDTYTVYDDQGNEISIQDDKVKELIEHDVEYEKSWDDCNWNDSEPDYGPEPEEDD